MVKINEGTLQCLSEMLKKRSINSFEVIKQNFEIGRIVSDACLEVGDQAVSEIAAAGSLSEGFLYDAMRVFRSLKSEAVLQQLRGRLNGSLSWWFLVNHCTKAPEGDTEEAELYWEGKLTNIEHALTEAERFAEIYDRLPASVREQVAGLMHAVSGPHKQQRVILDGAYKFGHLADIQMDEDFTTAGRVVIDPFTGKNERLLDINRCLSFAVDQIIATGCRACFIPGDITETPTPSPNVQGFLRENFTLLAQEMPVFVEPGNHGLSRNPGDSSALEFLKGRKNIYVVEQPSVFYQEGCEVNLTPSPSWPQKDCAKIFVLPFPQRNISKGSAACSIEEMNKNASNELKDILNSFRAQIDKTVPNILLAHITVAGCVGAENPEMLKYDPSIDPFDLRGFTYVALGHIHKYQQVADNAWYSGSIERMNFGEEDDIKGFNIVEINENKKPVVEFIETPATRFQTLTPEDIRTIHPESSVIYRVKGEMGKADYEALKPVLLEFQAPLQNRLTVKSINKVRDEGMTEDLAETEAVKRYLGSQGIDEAVLLKCLQAHTSLLQEDNSDTDLFETAELSFP